MLVEMKEAQQQILEVLCLHSVHNLSTLSVLVPEGWKPFQNRVSDTTGKEKQQDSHCGRVSAVYGKRKLLPL